MDVLWILLSYVLGAGMAIIVMMHPSEWTWGALVVVMIVNVAIYGLLKEFYWKDWE